MVTRVGGQVFGVDSEDAARLVDVAVQSFTATGVRSLAARQTASPIDTELVFVRRRTPFLENLQSVYQTFHWKLWGLLFLVLLFLAANLAFIDYMRVFWPARRQVDPETGFMTLKTLCETLWAIVATDKARIGRLCWDQVFNLGSLLFGQLPIRPSDDAPSRIMYILFQAFAFGLAAFYTALLVNQFQAKEDDSQVSMKKFCNGQQSDGRSLKDVHAAKGTSFQAYVRNYLRANDDICSNVGDDVKKLFDDSIPGGGGNLCDDPDTCLNLVADGKVYATLTDDLKSNWFLSNGLCNKLEVVGRTGSPTASTWILPLDANYSSLAESLSNAILLARDDGSFERIVKATIDQDGCKIEDLRIVYVRNMIGFFIPMAVMSVFALLLLLYKSCRSRFTDSDAPVWGSSAEVGPEVGA